MVITSQRPAPIIILDAELLESKANVKDLLLLEDFLDGQGILFRSACVRFKTGFFNECIESLQRAPSFSV